MMSTNHSGDQQDRGVETLSALFDGELQGDAARFAMKRLAHDPQWQRSFGNWQLLGDALRGQVGSLAPGDFAARVSAAVAAESVRGAPIPALAPAEAPVAVAAPAPAARRTWIGGAALAASVAVVAMLVARPFSADGGKAVPAPPATTELATAQPPASAPAARRDQASAEAVLPAAAAIAAARGPGRASDRRSRGQAQRAALRPSNSQAATATVARAEAVDEPAPRIGSDPFGPPQAEVASRPWPRAVLPGTGTGAFTASFNGIVASSPSFYPFEPRLPHAGEGAPAPAHGGDRR